jgi:hypothetical protein
MFHVKISQKVGFSTVQRVFEARPDGVVGLRIGRQVRYTARLATGLGVHPFPR